MENERDPNELAYIARRPGCGCLCFASTPEAIKDAETARSVATMLREGYSIERMTYEAVRKESWECAACRPARLMKQAPLFSTNAAD